MRLFFNWWLQYATDMDDNGDPIWTDGVQGWQHKENRSVVASELAAAQFCFYAAGICILQALLNDERRNEFTSSNVQVMQNLLSAFKIVYFEANSLQFLVMGTI
eukprot:gnl/MRDRNA2_/MRDRNA2_86004_c0_seq1.p1 gnl/MRDRNA2_/MRDRNA2_86004_c0~~gnl/MRDRNA2_/MRDRNA2_86004_c0_seq1.p1  ORF type:complete len:104 (-),score=10.13 gnl/MRDRNA2_/MRDRNA2_86004_c0_seq1:383-694(-)